jgi:AcrR family transcriptional regulator
MDAVPVTARARSTSDERREHVIAAAIGEFARHGFHATSTAAIARRAGISQPYIYALFPSKEELFLACHRAVTGRIRRAFVDAARAADSPEAAFAAMGKAYDELLTRRDELLFQLQTYAAAGGDERLRAAAGREFAGLIDEIASVTGVERSEVVRFVSVGMYLNVATALGLDGAYYPAKES